MFKKSLSILLSISMLASTFSGAFSAFAVEGDSALILRGKSGETTGLAYAQEGSGDGISFGVASASSPTELMQKAHNVENYSPLVPGTNTNSTVYLDGCRYIGTTPVHYYNENCFTGKNAKPQRYTDGVLNESCYPITNIDLVERDEEKGYLVMKDGAHADFVYDLGAIYNLNGMVITAADKKWELGQYQVYVTDNAKDYITYLDTNSVDQLEKIVDFDLKDSTGVFMSDTITEGNQNHAYKITRTMNAKYVILRISQSNLGKFSGLNSNNQLETYWLDNIRMSEFSVSGDFVKAVNDDTLVLRGRSGEKSGEVYAAGSSGAITFATYATTTAADLMENAVGIQDYTPIAGTTDNARTVVYDNIEKKVISDNQMKAEYYDGTINSGKDTGFGDAINETDGNSCWRMKDGYSIDLVYNLDAVYNLKGMVVAAPDDNTGNLSPFMPAAYEILVSTSNEDCANYNTDNFKKIVDFDLSRSTTITSTAAGQSLMSYDPTKKAGKHAYKINTDIQACCVVLRIKCVNLRNTNEKYYMNTLRFSEFTVSGERTKANDTLYIRNKDANYEEAAVKVPADITFVQKSGVTSVSDLLGKTATPIKVNDGQFGVWNYIPDGGYMASNVLNIPEKQSRGCCYIFPYELTQYYSDGVLDKVGAGLYQTRIFSNGSVVDGSYVDVVYDLGSVYKLTDLVIAPSMANWKLGSYQVYTAMNRQQRFNGELTKIIDYDIVNPTKKSAKQDQSRSANYQHAYNINKDLYARYVILRITDMSLVFGSNQDYRAVLRLSEFAVYGTPAEGEIFSKTPSTATYISSSPTAVQGNGDLKTMDEVYRDYFDITRNLLGNKSAEHTYLAVNAGVTTPQTTTYDPQHYYKPTTTNIAENGKTALLVDQIGVHDGAAVRMRFQNSDGSKNNDESKMYYQQTYTLDGQADISAFAVSWHPIQDLVASHFKVSIANSKEDLFTNNNGAYTKEYVGNKNNVIINNFDGTPVRGKYFAIRVICGISSDNYGYGEGDSYIRMNRLGLLGDYVNVDNGTGSGNTASHNLDTAKLTADNLVTVGAAAPAQGAVKDWNGKYAQGMYHSTYTANNEAVYNDTDSTPYDFKGWYRGEQLFSTENSVTASGALTAKYAIREYKVTFQDKDGTVLKTQKVAHGSAATGAPTNYTKVYGYSFNAWSQSLDKITAAITVKPTYTRDTNLKGSLTVNGQKIGDYEFDKRVELTSQTSVLWKLNEVDLAKGTTASFYALPTDMKVTTSASEAEPAAASVIGFVKTESDNTTRDITVFIHNNKANITDSGVIFANTTGYALDETALKACIGKANTDNKTSGVQVVKTGVTAADYMVTFNGVGSAKARFAKPYVVVNGEVVFGSWKQIN